MFGNSNLGSRAIMWRTFLSCLLVIGTLLAGRGSVLGQNHEMVLPQETPLFLSVPSVAGLMDSFQKTDFAKLIEIPEIEKVIIQLRPSMNDSGGDQWKGVDLERLPESSISKATYAIVNSGDGIPAHVLLFDRRDKLDGLNRFFANLERELVRNGWVHEPNSPDPGYEYKIYARSGALVERFELVIASWGETYLLATNSNVAKSIAENGIAKNPTSCLGEKDVFQAGMKAAKLSVPESFILYFEPIELSQILQTDRYDGVEPLEIAEKHGFNAIKGIFCYVAIPDEKFDLIYKAAVSARGPFQGAMRLMNFKNKPDLSLPDWLPNYLHTMRRFEWDWTQFLGGVAGPFNELVTNGTFEEVLEDMKASDGPGVDLENDLFSLFADSVYLLGESNPPLSKKSERSVICIELGDAQKVADSISLLLKDDPNSQSLKLPGQANPVWKIGLQSSKGPNLSSPGLCVANGKLFLASNTDAIKKLVLTANSDAPRLNSATDLKETFAILDEMAGKEGCMRSITRIDLDAQTAYELLRTGSTEGSESLYAEAVNHMIQAAVASGRPIPDFSSLPPFEEIAKYLGVNGTHVKAVDEGWLVTGFVKRK